MALHKVIVDERGVRLDNNLLQGVKSFTLAHREGEDCDELTLCMDVNSNSNGELNGLLNQSSDSTCGDAY